VRRRVLAGAVLAAVLVALTLAFAVQPAPAAQHRERVILSSLESSVLARLNLIREAHGLVPLRLSVPLTEAASQHSLEMGSDGYFAHSSFDGTTYWKRIKTWYVWQGYRFWSVGENLLWSAPSVDSAQALRLWMRSPEHRANILNPVWREIGISAVHEAAAPGAFDGRGVTIITTDFGTRLSAAG